VQFIEKLPDENVAAVVLSKIRKAEEKSIVDTTLVISVPSANLVYSPLALLPLSTIGSPPTCGMAEKFGLG